MAWKTFKGFKKFHDALYMYQKYPSRVKRKEPPKQWKMSRILDKSNVTADACYKAALLDSDSDAFDESSVYDSPNDSSTDDDSDLDDHIRRLSMKAIFSERESSGQEGQTNERIEDRAHKRLKLLDSRHPTPYPEKLAPVCEHPCAYGTTVSNFENAELTTLLDRIKTAHPYEDFTTIGPNKSKDILSDTLISKAYCLIYNIMQRCTHANHTIAGL